MIVFCCIPCVLNLEIRFKIELKYTHRIHANLGNLILDYDALIGNRAVYSLSFSFKPRRQ